MPESPLELPEPKLITRCETEHQLQKEVNALKAEILSLRSQMGSNNENYMSSLERISPKISNLDQKAHEPNNLMENSIHDDEILINLNSTPPADIIAIQTSSPQQHNSHNFINKYHQPKFETFKQKSLTEKSDLIVSQCTVADNPPISLPVTKMAERVRINTSHQGWA